MSEVLEDIAVAVGVILLLLFMSFIVVVGGFVMIEMIRQVL